MLIPFFMNRVLNEYLGYLYAAQLMTYYSTPQHLRDYTGFVPSVAPPATRTNPDRFVTPSRHYGRGVVETNEHSEGLPVHETATCAKCRNSMPKHPLIEIRDEVGRILQVACDRLPEDFGNHPHDYYRYNESETYSTPFVDFSGGLDEQDFRALEDEAYAGVALDNESSINDSDFYWVDGDPKECTSVLTGEVPKGFKINTTAYSARNKNVFVEGADGFYSIELINELLTEAYHNRLLNVYFKDGKLRCGGLYFEITRTKQFQIPFVKPETYLKVHAVCGNKECLYKDSRGNYCKRTLSLEGFVFTREQMETFVYDVIRHGNNHAADWFKTRVYPDVRVLDRPVRTFYKVHHQDCDLVDCDDEKAYCPVQLRSREKVAA